MDIRKILNSGIFMLASIFLSSGWGAAFAGTWNDVTDPLVVAKAVADKELFGRIIRDDDDRPEFKMHHGHYWRDATLMSGVAELYDRTEELGIPVPRYLDYIKAWGEKDPGGFPFPIWHGDAVCAGQTYIWLFERSGRTSDHIDLTDGMIDLVFKGRKLNQWGTGYNDYWMRFWNDDIHMVPPFLARRGRAAGSRGIPNGKDARDIAMEYCRAYADILRDPVTGLFWHDPKTIGSYQWGRGNGWAAAGYTKVMDVLEDDPEYAEDVEWLAKMLLSMSFTLKDNRNVVGTWNADVLNREKYDMPETSGSVFFVYMMAGMINRGRLPDDFIPVVQKAWHFLKLSVTDEGALMRVQPVGAGPIEEDFETLSQTYGVGGFLLAAAELSRMPEQVLEKADQVECIKVGAEDLEIKGDQVKVTIKKLWSIQPDFPPDTGAKVQAVLPGRRLPETFTDREQGLISITNFPQDYHGDVFLFYKE
jgi:rhamnogalacturonyl hydrolase YesR